MTIKCDFMVQWNATPEQLTAVGMALWRWCIRARGPTGTYRCIDNQPLADLIAGQFPVSCQAEHGGIHIRIQDEASLNRQATITSLRQELPTEGIKDVWVDGQSWTLSV